MWPGRRSSATSGRCRPTTPPMPMAFPQVHPDQLRRSMGSAENDTCLHKPRLSLYGYGDICLSLITASCSLC